MVIYWEVTVVSVALKISETCMAVIYGPLFENNNPR